MCDCVVKNCGQVPSKSPSNHATNRNRSTSLQVMRLIPDSICESSLNFKVRVGRTPFLILFPFLAVTSLVLTHVFEYMNHEQDNIPFHAVDKFVPIPENLVPTVLQDALSESIFEMSNTTPLQADVKNVLFELHNATSFEQPKKKFFTRTTRQILKYEQISYKNNKANFPKERRLMMQPSSQSLSPNATLTACLLIKDDNDILSEWIAYHYYTLKLRYLIVAVDPSSVQSPSPILAKWKLLTDLEIIEWNDNDYMPKYFLENGHAPLEYLTKSDISNDVSVEG